MLVCLFFCVCVCGAGKKEVSELEVSCRRKEMEAVVRRNPRVANGSLVISKHLMNQWAGFNEILGK